MSIFYGKSGSARVFASQLNERAIKDILAFCDSPILGSRHVVIMPDGHTNGNGTVTGFTCQGGEKTLLKLEHDAGCGVLAVEVEGEVDYIALDKACHDIPAGRGQSYLEPAYDYDFTPLRSYSDIESYFYYPVCLGSLGGGNHFIELDQDESGKKYLIVHNGLGYLSGACVDSYKRRVAAKLGKEVSETTLDELILEGKDREDYLFDMDFFVRLCIYNRAYIANYIIDKMGWNKGESLDVCHHFTSQKDGIVRHGAISAHKGEKVIIPINSKEGCILGIGKGNPEWNYSAPHGAGRLYSRKTAFNSFSMEDYQNAMAGIYSTSVLPGNIDEIPMAYRSRQTIVEAIKESVEVTNILTPLYSYKGI